MASTQFMIQVEHINKFYGKKENRFQALDDISFSIETGESVAIVGKSGSGKSTLMHVLSGLDKVDSGTIVINGNILSQMSKKKIAEFRNKNIGFVFQTFYIQPQETCSENIMLPLEIAGIGMSERKQRAQEALTEVGLEDKAKNKATDLSGGQKQRLCIARAIINKPEIIFADEPTGNLDSENGQKVIDLLFSLNQKGTTLIIVTHDLDIAALCKKRIHLIDGKVSHID